VPLELHSGNKRQRRALTALSRVCQGRRGDTVPRIAHLGDTAPSQYDYATVQHLKLSSSSSRQSPKSRVACFPG
jgi:hypothetical protein